MPIRTSRSTRSGWRRASDIAIIPPIEPPTTWVCESPSRSNVRTTLSARPSMQYGPGSPGCHRDRAGRSHATGTVAERGYLGSHMAVVDPSEPSHTTYGVRLAGKRSGHLRALAAVVRSVARPHSRVTPLRRRLAFMRSGWTTSRSRLRLDPLDGRPAAAAQACSAGHSACQAPGRPLQLVAAGGVEQRGHRAPAPASPPAWAVMAAIGFCLWAIDDDPPAPSATSDSSPTSLWASRITSRATLAAAVATTAHWPAITTVVVGWLCVDGAGAGEAEPDQRSRRRGRRGARRTIVRHPLGPPRETRRSRHPGRRLAERHRPNGAVTVANVVGTACWPSVLAIIGVSPRGRRARRRGRRAAPSRRRTVLGAAGDDERGGGVDDVLAGGTAMDVTVVAVADSVRSAGPGR